MPSSLKTRLITGGVWVFAGKAVTAGAGLAVTAVVANLISKEEFGAYGLALRLVVVATLASQLGMQNAIVRLVAQAQGDGRPGRARAALREVFRLAFVGAAGVAAFLVLGGGEWLARTVLHSPWLALSIGLVAAVAAFKTFEVLVSESFRGFQDLRAASLFGGVLTSVFLLLFVLGLRVQAGTSSLRQVLALTAIAAALSVLAGALALRRRAARLGPPEPLRRREIFSISLPLWVTSLTSFALVQMDVLILGAFVSESSVAEYFAAARLVEVVSQPLVLVNLVVPPFIAKMYFSGDRQPLQRLLRATATLAGVPALLVLLAFVLFGGTIMGLIYPAELRGGAVVLAVLSVGRLVNVLTGSCGVTMAMTGHQAKLMRITITTSVLTLVASLLAVGRFGALGLAVTVATGTIVQNLVMWIGTRRHTGLWTHVGLPRPSDVRALLGRD